MTSAPVTLTHQPSGAATVSAQPAAPLSPVSGRAAAAILGTMVAMILALTAVLVDATWYHPDAAVESPAAEQSGIAQR